MKIKGDLTQMKSSIKALTTFFICLIVLGIGEYFVKSTDICNLVIISVMLITIFIEALASRRKLVSITASIKKVSEELKNSHTLTSTIKNKFVSECISDYKTLKRKYIADHKLNASLIEISDYINSDKVYTEIHKDIVDQIANTMTGLGILGTFIGLSIGLQGFHTDGAQAITDSIPALLNGIKTAFYTSIGGVLISLIFTHFYHSDLEANNEAIEDFYDAFYNNISVPAESYYYQSMLKNQELQTKSLNALAASIGDELAPRLAKEIKSSIVPTMEHLNKLITASVNTTIEDYIKAAVQTQSDTLQEIVDEFMVKMNQSLKNQFENLASSIDHMCSSQHSYTEEIQTIIESLTGISNHLSDLNKDMSGTVNTSKEVNQTSLSLYNQLKEFVGILADYQKAIKTSTEELSKQTAASMEYFNKNTGVFDENVAGLIENINKLREENNAAYEAHVAKLSENMADFLDKVHIVNSALIEQAKSYKSNYDEHVANLSENMSDFINRINKINSVLINQAKDNQIFITNAKNEINGSISQIGSVAENLPELLEISKLSRKLDVMTNVNSHSSSLLRELLNNLSELINLQKSASSSMSEKINEGMLSVSKSIDNLQKMLISENEKSKQQTLKKDKQK